MPIRAPTGAPLPAPPAPHAEGAEPRALRTAVSTKSLSWRVAFSPWTLVVRFLTASWDMTRLSARASNFWPRRTA